MSVLPKVFIGSSKEGRKVAYYIQEYLEGQVADTTVWDQGLFDLSTPSILSLIKITSTFDFVVFALCDDDITMLRGERVVTARDNVIFELGLAIGGLGLDRTYIVAPDDVPDFHLPTDLLGLTCARYNATRSNLHAALGPACIRIEDAIRRFESKSDKTPQLADSLPFTYSGAICFLYTKRGVQFLLVKSDQGRWIFPKGRIDSNDPQEMAKRYAHDEGGVYGSVKAVDPIIYRHFKEEDGQEQLIGGFLIEKYSTMEPRGKFREPEWFDLDSATTHVSQLRPFVYAQEMWRVLREAHNIIRERFRPIAQCAAMPFRRKKGYCELLMITSLGSKTWILPKGNIENTCTPQESAEKEAFEEAGVKGRILDEPVGSYMYRKDNITACIVDVYPLEVREQYEEWPDRTLRRRKWFSVDAAINHTELDELKQALIDFRRKLE